MNQKATGAILLHLSPDEKVHVSEINNAKAMWDKIAEIHRQQNAASRYNALNDLTNIRLSDGETLPASTPSPKYPLQAGVVVGNHWASPPVSPYTVAVGVAQPWRFPSVPPLAVLRYLVRKPVRLFTAWYAHQNERETYFGK